MSTCILEASLLSGRSSRASLVSQDSREMVYHLISVSPSHDTAFLSSRLCRLQAFIRSIYSAFTIHPTFHSHINQGCSYHSSSSALERAVARDRTDLDFSAVLEPAVFGHMCMIHVDVTDFFSSTLEIAV